MQALDTPRQRPPRGGRFSGPKKRKVDQSSGISIECDQGFSVYEIEKEVWVTEIESAEQREA